MKNDYLSNRMNELPDFPKKGNSSKISLKIKCDFGTTTKPPSFTPAGKKLRNPCTHTLSIEVNKNQTVKKTKDKKFIKRDRNKPGFSAPF